MGFYGRRKTVVKRSKDVIEAEKATKLALSKTCQICARPIFAETGVIAHHGYQRPEGWHSQTASCVGARHVPFEVSCDALRDHVEKMGDQIRRMETNRADLAADAIPATFTWTYYDRSLGYSRQAQRSKSVSLTAENFATVKTENSSVFMTHSLHSYQEAKDRDLRERDQNIKSLREYCEWQESRMASWTQTFKRENGEWVTFKEENGG